MKKKFLFIATIIFIPVAAFAQSRCLTPEFYDARTSLFDAYGGYTGHPNDPALADIQTHNVGDTVTFWSWDLTRQPPVWEHVPATCRAVTANCYVFVADDQWNINMDSSDVAQVAYYWEEGTYRDSTSGIYALDTQNFGNPPDALDNDPHIYIFYDALGSYNGVVFDGYFSVFNEFTEEQARGMGGHSNEVEMFYMSCYPGDPVSPIRISVLAHEFEHMIHWASDGDEATWVDEGCAEYAMLLFGQPDPLINFPTAPDNDLTVWGNTFADYIQTFMFFTYVGDHFGGPSTLRAIVQEPANSMDGVETALLGQGYEISFADLFTNWAIANYYHGAGGDQLENPDSLHIYFSIDPPAFSNSGVHSTYPVNPTSRTVSHWAADYIKFNNPNRSLDRLDLSFDGDANGDYGLAVFADSTPSGYRFERVFPVNSDWQGYYPNFGYSNNMVLMVANLLTSGPTTYRYSANAITGVIEDPVHEIKYDLGSIYPNPFNQNVLIRFNSGRHRNIQMGIYDVMGRLVKSMALEQTRSETIWDGKDWQGNSTSSGIYFFKFSDGQRSQVIKGTLLR